MKKVCVITATRAEYGLVRSLIKALSSDEKIDLKLVVTGMHLCRDYGMTYKEIEKDGFVIDRKIDIMLSSNTCLATSKSMALALLGFAEYFEQVMPDLIILDGDRYEMLAVSIAAMNQGIPIAHIGGGELTEGVLDDSIRHCITKLSHIHFVINEAYRNRVIQLGENPEHVYNVGSLGVENSKKVRLLSRQALSESIKFDLKDKFVLVTFHPVLDCIDNIQSQVKELLLACSYYTNLKFIFTKANADVGGETINQLLKVYVEENADKTCLIDSLGTARYLSAVKYCECVVGNSSSGIIEVPSFRKATVNIGDRQKGRIQAKSILNCEAEAPAIISCMKKAMSLDFQLYINDVKNPYEGIEPSKQIKEIIDRFLNSNKRIKTKVFFDIDYGSITNFVG